MILFEFNEANFGPIEYVDARGRKQRGYQITKDGFSFLVMGNIGVKVGSRIFIYKYINV